MTTLFIDTSDNKKIRVHLSIDGKSYIKEETVSARSSQKVLPVINTLLKDHMILPKDITSIEVNEGPGSFTGVRVGVAIGNAFAYVLGIPINGKSIISGKSSVEPKY